IEARVTGSEVARSAQRAECGAVEAQVVPAIAIEVAERVGIRRAVLAEYIAVLPRATGELIVPAASFDPVIAGVAVDRVVAAAADQRVVARGSADQLTGCWCGCWCWRAIDDRDIGSREGRGSLKRGDPLRAARSVAVGIVEEVSAGR